MKKQIITFLIVGVFSFAIEMGILHIGADVLNLDPVLATIISFITSLIFNYFATIKWVFNVENNKKSFFNFGFFIIMAIIGLFINIVIVYLGVEVLGQNLYICKLFAVTIVMVINFIAKKIFLEYKGK